MENEDIGTMQDAKNIEYLEDIAGIEIIEDAQGVKIIAVIGGGWYGAHIALMLARLGNKVTLFEKNADIFSQLSGNYGIRLHAGPHYPRSSETRKSCHRGFEDFLATYPDLVIPHDYSVYGLGHRDANNEPSKVTPEQFEVVCQESPSCQKINASDWGYHHLLTAMTMDEPSIAVGARLREQFRAYLNDAGVTIKCNYDVKTLEKQGNRTVITNGTESESFTHVINATSYQALLPPTIPFEMDIVYQTCLILIYEDQQSTEKPFSFTVMDGWYPCLMPYVDQEDSTRKPNRDYALYHAKWTIMGSFPTVAQATHQLTHDINADFVATTIRPECEKDIIKFWPDFQNRFKYSGYRANVLAKIKTNKEFRSAVTFEHDGVIHIVPGKINNIFDASNEAIALINQQNVLTKDDYRYVQGGILDSALAEIIEKPVLSARNTCELQTYQELSQPLVETTAKKIAITNHSFWTTLPSPSKNADIIPLTPRSS